MTETFEYANNPKPRRPWWDGLRRIAKVFLILGTLFLLVISKPWRQFYSFHFKFPLPATAAMLNDGHTWGLDTSERFEFSFSDDQLRDAIIKQFNMKPADLPLQWRAYMSTPAWWPGSSLGTLPEAYKQSDQTGQRLMWIDRERKRIYVELSDT